MFQELMLSHWCWKFHPVSSIDDPYTSRKQKHAYTRFNYRQGHGNCKIQRTSPCTYEVYRPVFQASKIPCVTVFDLLLERLHAVISRAVLCMMRILVGFVQESLTCHNFVIPTVPQRSGICHMHHSGHRYFAYSVMVREFKKETACLLTITFGPHEPALPTIQPPKLLIWPSCDSLLPPHTQRWWWFGSDLTV